MRPERVRPGVFHLFGFRLISCFCVDRFLFRFGGRFLRPPRACHVGERDCMAREIRASNPDPRVLVTWVKKICRLSSHLIHHPDKPDGVWYRLADVSCSI